MLTRRDLITATGAALFAGSAGKAIAQGDRTIRIIAGFPAGGGIDL
jgi:tripartite-type tricarboxylate transporter receptor subunit TctC